MTLSRKTRQEMHDNVLIDTAVSMCFLAAGLVLNGEFGFGEKRMGGTPDDYEFVEAPDIDDYISVTPEQLYLNRELVHKDIIAMLEKGGEE